MKVYFTYLLPAIIYYLLFAYDIENDRDFWTWVWLLNSIIWGYIFIKDDLKSILGIKY